MRNRRKKRRGISAGTIAMLMVTSLVILGLVLVLPPLVGDRPVQIDTSQMLSGLNLGEIVPTLSLSQIPLEDDHQTAPAPSVNDTSSAGGEIPLPQATPAPQAAKSFSFIAGGTLIIDNTVRRSAYHEESKTYDFSQMISSLTQDLRTEFSYMTLENLVHPGSKLSDLVTTEEALSMFPEAGVDGINLGHSRAMNLGPSGLHATIDALREKKLSVLGAFASQEDADTPRLMTLGEVKVAFLSFVQTLSKTGERAMKQSKSSYAIPLLTQENMAAAISRAREAGAQAVVVNVYWSGESKDTPSKEQVSICQQLADLGADVIIGTGTHRVQQVTWLSRREQDGTLRQVLCAYGLGNVITSSTKPHETASMLLHCTLSLDGDGILRYDQLEFTPTYVWKYSEEGKTHFQVIRSADPRPASMDDKSAAAMGKAFQSIESLMQESPLNLR